MGARPDVGGERVVVDGGERHLRRVAGAEGRHDPSGALGQLPGRFVVLVGAAGDPGAAGEVDDQRRVLRRGRLIEQDGQRAVGADCGQRADDRHVRAVGGVAVHVGDGVHGVDQARHLTRAVDGHRAGIDGAHVQPFLQHRGHGGAGLVGGVTLRRARIAARGQAAGQQQEWPSGKRDMAWVAHGAGDSELGPHQPALARRIGQG